MSDRAQRTKNLAWRLGPSALFFVSLLVLRFQLTSDLNFTFRQALEGGIVAGWLYDIAAISIIYAAGTLFSTLTGWRPAWLIGASSFILWLASLANVLHFRFFGMRLDWWIVRLHWRDLLVVKGSAADLALTPAIVASVAACIASLVVLGLASRRTRRRPPLAPPRSAPRLKRDLAVVVGISLLSLVCWRLPNWLNWRFESMVLSDQIARVWWYQNTRDTLYVFTSSEWMHKLSREASVHEQPSAYLARYRDFKEDAPPDGEPVLEDQSDRRNLDDAWPLLQHIEPHAETTKTLRRTFGLPEETRPNVIFLFIESMRSFELQHDQLGPIVFPRLRAVLAEKGLHFTQAYSSSFTAGQTVRGQFSTQCSALPNIAGAAVYVAHTTLRIHCVQSLFRDNGYRTLWMNSYRSTFHNKRQFETLHGTETFFDGSFYKSRGVTQRIGQWGFADLPFLRVSVDALEEVAAEGKPFYSNILTISTHHPHTLIDEGKLPDTLMAAAAKHPEYLAYLSRLRYADEAIGAFFDDFFASSLAENTVVVLLGDHSVGVRPHLPVSKRQMTEIDFRVPLAVITKNMPEPRQLHRPVHQVDIVPTMARTAALVGTETWVGRGLFAAETAPWVYRVSDRLHYRTATRSCYTFSSKGKPVCFDTRGKDPMQPIELQEVPEDPLQSAFFDAVIEANLRSIALNKIAPPALELSKR